MLLLRRSWVRGLELSVLFWNFSFKIKKFLKKCSDVKRGQLSLLFLKARQRSQSLSPGPLSWPDRLPTLSPPAATRTPCPQPPTLLLAQGVCSGQMLPPRKRAQLHPSRFRPNPTQPEGLTHHPTEGDGHPSRLCPCLLYAFQAPTLCAQVHSLKCKLPEDRPPTL